MCDKEINLYNLGVLKNYEYQSYKDEEIVLLEFFDKVIELFAEHNIELSYNFKSWRCSEVVTTRLTRNQLYRKVPWVRIPPSPPM